MRKLILCAFLTCINLNIFAQQVPQYTQYRYNMSIVNPAYAGYEDILSIGFLGKRQWVGVTGAPETYTAFGHGRVSEKLGLGLNVVSDRVGPENKIYVNTDMSYTVDISETFRLGLGVKGGVIFHNVGLTDLQQEQGSDQLFNENVNKTYPNVGVGLLAYSERFYLSISVPNFVRTLYFDQDEGRIANAAEEIHTFIGSGYIFDVSSMVKLKPSFLLKYAIDTPMSLDVSLNLLWNQKIEFGTSYRLDDAVSALVNFKVTENIRIGYAYEYAISNIGEYSSGSHEIIVLADFFPSNKKRYVKFY